jgi:hypothetical protein
MHYNRNIKLKLTVYLERHKLPIPLITNSLDSWAVVPFWVDHKALSYHVVETQVHIERYFLVQLPQPCNVSFVRTQSLGCKFQYIFFQNMIKSLFYTNVQFKYIIMDSMMTSTNSGVQLDTSKTKRKCTFFSSDYLQNIFT